MRKFRKKTETEVRDNSGSDDDTELILPKETSSLIDGKSKVLKKSSAIKGIIYASYGWHLAGVPRNVSYEVTLTSYSLEHSRTVQSLIFSY